MALEGSPRQGLGKSHERSAHEGHEDAVRRATRGLRRIRTPARSVVRSGSPLKGPRKRPSSFERQLDRDLPVHGGQRVSCAKSAPDLYSGNQRRLLETHSRDVCSREWAPNTRLYSSNPAAAVTRRSAKCHYLSLPKHAGDAATAV